MSAIQVGTIQVAVVEDDVRLRRTFVDVLESSTAFRCVGTFATGAEALEGIPKLVPDVVIMDVNLPDTTGVECVKTLAPKLPGTQIHELEQLLAADPARLARGFVGHMARYVTGADLSYADRRAVGEIVASAAPTQYGVRSLIHAIAASPLLRGTR